MLTQIHLLLTYKCTLECDHCFCYSSPSCEGTMNLSQIQNVFNEAEKIGSVVWIYFEGGEPFLYYPILLEGIRLARSKGFKVGIVTNSYWATSVEDAEAWLKPLAEMKIHDLSLSDDQFHYDEDENLPKNARRAAEKLGIPLTIIEIQKPYLEAKPGEGVGKGKAVIGGGAMFKGRAVEKLLEGLPTVNSNELNVCPHEDLENPERVHIDCYGQVQLCQGLSIGNMFQKPLSEIIGDYDPHSHPICGPLIEGGPSFLAEELNVPNEDEYVDECHFCYEIRKALIEHYPEYLAPKQVYGIS